MTAAQEGVEKPNIGGRLILAWELSRRSRKRDEQRQSVVQHMCRDRKRDPNNRCEDAQPPMLCLEREAETCPEHAGEHGVSAKPKQRISAAELQAVRRHSRFRRSLAPRTSPPRTN